MERGSVHEGERLAGSAPWHGALRVAQILAADPHGCGGVVLRAGAGPVRDRWLAALRGFLPPGTSMRRMPPGLADDALIGGLDLSATLAAGRPVAQAGLLAQANDGLLVVPMAERMAQGTAGHLAAALDTGFIHMERDGLGGCRPARFGLILLDEGIGADETVPATLAERLAFHLDLTDLSLADSEEFFGFPALRQETNAPTADDPLALLCGIAEALGVASLRGPLLAMRVARLLARCEGRADIAEAEAGEAARLVLGSRATRRPVLQRSLDEAQVAASNEEPAAAPPETAPGSDRDADSREGGAASPDERLVAAALAAIPSGLLARLDGDGPRLRAPKAGKSGAKVACPRTGRPMGAKLGDPRRGRLDLIATLRAAAPWQRVRGREAAAAGEPRGLLVAPDDIRITRFRQRTETTTIFAVDASGSAALERLAEAKGAVELLLAEAYTRRDKVALIAFRGMGADLLLPPTRSLVRARRGLAALPGGGGTPLAAGIDAASAVALGVHRGGGTPVVVILTDGRANVARSGATGRMQAGEDSLAAGRLFREMGVRALLIDTAARSQEAARNLAGAMGARYLPMPYADAGAMSAAIRSASP